MGNEDSSEIPDITDPKIDIKESSLLKNNFVSDIIKNTPLNEANELLKLENCKLTNKEL